MLTAAIIVFVAAILIHSISYALMGLRANMLPGGAIGMAILTSLRLEGQPETPMFWAMLIVLVGCAMLGHACSVGLIRLVMSKISRV